MTISRILIANRSTLVVGFIALLGVLCSLPLAFSQSLEEYAAVVGKPDDFGRAANVGTPTIGGTLQVAESAEHISFDGHLNTRGNVIELNTNIAEGLFSLNADGVPVPSLADNYHVSDDGLVYTIEIRQGVPFHNGDELEAADVVASLGRWMEGPFGGVAAGNIASVEETGRYTVELTLTRPFPFVIYQLAVPQGGAAFIYPQEQVEAAGTDDIGEPIGTGPYMIDEYRENQFLRLVRFDEYVGRPEPASGFAGGKVAYLDEIVFNYVPDEAVRIAGLQAGDFHVARDITADQHSRFANSATVRPRIVYAAWPCVNFNKRQGPMTDLRVRQAFLAAIDPLPIMSALGPEEFWATGPSLMMPDSMWANEVGLDAYLSHDPDRARQLLEEAGYDGQPIRWLVDPGRSNLYIPALVAQPMLEQAGFVIELVPVDAATLGTYRADPNRMEAFSCAYAPRQDPTIMTPLQSSHPGWWDTEEKAELIEQMQLSDDLDERLALWEELTAHFYEYVPLVKFGDLSDLYLEAETYSGAWFETNHFYYPNTWLNQ